MKRRRNLVKKTCMNSKRCKHNFKEVIHFISPSQSSTNLRFADATTATQVRLIPRVCDNLALPSIAIAAHIATLRIAAEPCIVSAVWAVRVMDDYSHACLVNALLTPIWLYERIPIRKQHLMIELTSPGWPVYSKLRRMQYDSCISSLCFFCHTVTPAAVVLTGV